ncbi:hypothetical protein BKA83DRAFT_93473 [Pisolithus microcarpus]|nr:hypothetical protein BKA83DRAFT_93473 [Pisolithus microcarpus]
MDVDNAKANSGKGSACLGHAWNTVIVKPTTLAFYPPLWTKLLDKAKARIQLYVATKEPFLRLETAVDGQCSEEIIELVVKYQEDQSELEAGFYPQYKRSMAWMLFNDTQTFWSKINKVAVRIVPIEYNLSAPKSATTKHEWLDAVKQKATALLEGAKFLRGECDSLICTISSSLCSVVLGLASGREAVRPSLIWAGPSLALRLACGGSRPSPGFVRPKPSRRARALGALVAITRSCTVHTYLATEAQSRFTLTITTNCLN